MSVRKIMVVDDEPAIGRLLCYQLRGFGYEVCYVQDGLLALEHVLVERPDLILLDVVMPLVSGWDVCRAIRGVSSVPIIMLTGKSADADVVTGLEAGADDYVTKPFSVAQLRARIEAVLRRAGGAQSVRRQAQNVERETLNAERGTLSAEGVPADRQRPLIDHRLPTTSRRPTAIPDPPAAVHSPSSVVSGPSPLVPGPPPLAPRPSPLVPGQGQPQRVGARMRAERQRRGITLLQAERDCRVRWEFLQALEQENWVYLPRQQLRPAALAYSAFLGMDPAEVAGALPQSAPPRHVPAMALTLVLLLLVVVGLTLL